MYKNRIKIIITGVLIVVFILVCIKASRVLRKSSKSKKTPSASASMSYPMQTTILIGKREWNEDKDLTWKRCPFSGVSYSRDASEDLTIYGIIWDEVKPKAIISGQIVGEGEAIGKFFIEKIEKQRVILSDGERTIELNM